MAGWHFLSTATATYLGPIAIPFPAGGPEGEEVIPMYRIAIPMQRMHEKREARETRARRLGFNADRVLEIYFAVLTIVILGGIVGLGAYIALSIIPAWQKYQSPAWQRFHSPVNLAYPQSAEFQSHSPDPK